MLIDANNLLQADATVIAGVLILLTIYSLKIPARISTADLLSTDLLKSTEEIQRKISEKKIQVRLAWIIISIIIPFVISAVMLLIVDWYEGAVVFMNAAKIFAIGGFVYLIISVALIVMIPMHQIDPFTRRAGGDL